ncbi:MAG: hypothetical protein K6E27_09325 [Eubacterium sp.]|nr:hypothetical protein [Eubacterium sp.]
MYNAQTNSIYIFAGILEAPVYSKYMTYEENLAGLFTIVGHEITRGFDKDGSQYDKDGLNNPILSDDDLKGFNDLNNRGAGYYSIQSPFTGSGMVLGQNLCGEATADMGGIKATLYLAEKEDNFDYDTYFRAYARLWRTNVTLEAEKNSLANDVHPLALQENQPVVEIAVKDAPKAKEVLEQNGIQVLCEVVEKSSLEDFYFRLIGGSKE